MKAIRHDELSVFIEDKKKGVNFWFDVWLEDGEINCDWNKYIFFKDCDDDMELQKYQENCDNFEMAYNTAVEYLENKNLI